MALTVGELLANLKLDDSDFNAKLNNAERQSERSGGLISRSLGGAGNFISNAFSTAAGFIGANIFGAVAGGIKNVAGSMISGNAAFEQYQTKFKVLLGSTEAAQQRMAELADFGANTPFELPGVVEADSILQGFGLHSDEAAKKFGFSGREIRTIAGDVASGTGSSFQEMSLLIGKFSAGATGEAISRMAELGITNRNELANMGLEFSKSGELLTPLPEAMSTVLALMKQKYGGLMDAQSSTFDGMMSNLQDWMSGTLRTLGAPIFEVLKDKLSVLLTYLSAPETQAMITAFAGALATGIGGAIDFISNTAIPLFMGAWAALQPAIAAIIPVIATVIGVFQSGGNGATVFGSSITTLGEIWNHLQGIINAAAAVIRAIVTAVFSAVAGFLKEHGTEIRAFLQQTWDRISAIIRLALALIQATIIPALKAIAAFISEHSATIQAILGAAWSIIQGVINVALSIITGVIKTALALIKGDWSGAWTAIKEMLSGVWEGLKQIVSGATTYIKSILSLAWDAIKGTASSAWEGVKSTISGAVEGIKTAVRDKINEIIGYVEGLPGRFGRAGEALIKALYDGILRKFSDLLRLVREKLSELTSLLPGSEPKDPTSPLRGLGRRGEALVGNFQAGINAASLNLRPMVDSLAAQLPQLEAMGRGAGNTMTNNVTYQISANYAHQDERSLKDDIRLLQMMGA